MKKFILYAFILGSVFSCTNDSYQPLVKTGSFHAVFQSNDAEGGRIKSLEDASSIFMTIEDEQKNIVLDKKISLIKLNGDYLTESIPLSEGNYMVTRFLVLDENDNAIYGTPMQGSRDAHLIDHSLPISFTVTHDQSTSLLLEVISLEFRTASDIGYAAFQIQYKCPLSAAVNNDPKMCYDDGRYLIAYASVPGEPSFFSISTDPTPTSDSTYREISIETSEFTGPGTYTIKKYDGGSERSTYGYFANIDVKHNQLSEYNSVSGTLVVASIRHIEGTASGLATGTFTMTADDGLGHTIELSGSFKDMRGMGWWD